MTTALTLLFLTRARSSGLGRHFAKMLAGKGASGGATFAEPGVYPYFCAKHPSMRGEVVVR